MRSNDIFGLLNGKDEVLFNLLYLINEDKTSFIKTDNLSYIIAKSPKVPSAWLFVNDSLSIESETEIVNTVSDMLAENSGLIINGESARISDVLRKISEKCNIPYSVKMPLNVYACYEKADVYTKGQMIKPSQKYVDDVARLLHQMVLDSESIDIGEKTATDWANARKNADNLFLWKDEIIVAMAMVAHETSKYARINTVVTDREHRGKGYAKMLICTLTSQLLDKGKIPMLYADANNPSSNAVYRKAGYVYQGEITEFQFGEQNA
ncbi:MAG: GNAT family N-acetyltransferase [Clostridia bacterium]|nr:GNAT family N-acetyltransferase [Clostridia bacterium]